MGEIVTLDREGETRTPSRPRGAYAGRSPVSAFAAGVAGAPRWISRHVARCPFSKAESARKFPITGWPMPARAWRCRLPPVRKPSLRYRPSRGQALRPRNSAMACGSSVHGPASAHPRQLRFRTCSTQREIDGRHAWAKLSPGRPSAWPALRNFQPSTPV